MTSTSKEVYQELHEACSVLQASLTKLQDVTQRAVSLPPSEAQAPVSASAAELQRLLLSELSASRAQVDRLLDQQSMLIAMIAKATGLNPDNTDPSSFSSKPTPAMHPALAPRNSGTSIENTQSNHVTPLSTASPVTTLFPQRKASSAVSAAVEHQTESATSGLDREAASVASFLAQAFTAVEHFDVLTDLPTTVKPRTTSHLAKSLDDPQPSHNVTVESATEETNTFQIPLPAARSPALSAESGGEQRKHLDTWAILLEGDGGREVHSLQVALLEKGYFCGEDEMEWWMFGDSTANALRTFQACCDLPESGVCDERTWRALLGADAEPKDVYSILNEEYSGGMLEVKS